jgi:hypothetical protein
MTTFIPVPPGRPGTARVEYLANREETEDMLAKGYSVRMVFEHLKEQGRITCGYSAFCDYVRGRGRPKHDRKTTKGRIMQAPTTEHFNTR